ncbi:hypothetical protein ACPOM7_23620 [Peribacillus castrilensis]|uniref:hypothetical protein n=1 Tax=Bacillaceae TaxID=186817 RepID=UPI000660245E|nr:MULTISPECIES: hypothetical protein [Bacillaceae]MCP1092262.1 hypothetical protein [Bacillaceae bacterium OS4b]MBD8590002.1 hypothetical protein [Peribacillus simplex]MCF7624403.1 hypothetical protein [Peribacillus frigoritolerans]MCP1154969.1 hypothetical protein [Peribacillus frigoritolerans]MCT1390681.1 hypothetical protein [Peribacillus frigoritolerans]
MKDKLVLKRVWNKTSQQFLLLKHKVDWNGRNETPAGKAWHGRPRRRSEEAPGPPTVSECLKWKSTFPFYKPTKKLSANNYYLVCEQKGFK